MSFKWFYSSTPSFWSKPQNNSHPHPKSSPLNQLSSSLNRGKRESNQDPRLRENHHNVRVNGPSISAETLRSFMQMPLHMRIYDIVRLWFCCHASFLASVRVFQWVYDSVATQ